MGVAALGIAASPRAESDRSLLLLEAESSTSDRAVSEAEWAARLVDTLGLAPVMPPEVAPADHFGLLCPDRAELSTQPDGRRSPADRAYRVALDVPRPRDGGPTRVIAQIPATALYQLSVEGSGPQRWSVDEAPVGQVDPSALGLAQVPAVMPLRKGPHELSALLGRGSRADRIELTAYRPLCIAPAGGWRAHRPLSFGAKARTLVHALGLERHLPLAGEPVPVEGERFSNASTWGGTTNRQLAAPASSSAWAAATENPAEFTYRIRLREPGVFTLMARVHGTEPQIWTLDGRYRVTVQPSPEAVDFQWLHVLTLELGAGDHAVTALVPRGSGIDLLRFAPRRSGDADYVALLESMGFEEGPPAATVSQSASRANLANPALRNLHAQFLPRLARGAGGDPILLVEDRLERLYSRPLSPLLPAEL